MSLASLIIVGLVALAVATLLIPAARFATCGGAATDLGDLTHADLSTGAEWVSGTGIPDGRALAFRRLGESGSFRLTRLRDRPSLWVVLPVPETTGGETAAAGSYVPPQSFEGRLVTLRGAGPMLGPVVDMIETRSRGEARASEPTYLLLEGDSPQSYRPLLVLALLLAMAGLGCLSFAAVLMKRAA